MQEAYLRAFKYFDSFTGSNARPWLLSIVRHACYDWLRENRVLVTTPLADDPDLKQIGEAAADVGRVAGGVIGASRRTL